MPCVIPCPKQGKYSLPSKGSIYGSIKNFNWLLLDDLISSFNVSNESCCNNHGRITKYSSERLEQMIL